MIKCQEIIKNKKGKITLFSFLFLFILIFTFSINYVGGEEINYFNNTLTAENLTFTGNENITRYLEISKYSIVSSATLDLSGYNDTTECNQEFANVSTSCGGLNTGLYFLEGEFEYDHWDNDTESAIFDGNWSSYSWDKIQGANWMYMYVNYSKVTNAVYPSLWEFKFDVGKDGVSNPNRTNVTIPLDCWNQQNIALRVDSKTNSGGKGWIKFNCYDGSSWVQLYYEGDTSFPEIPAKENSRFYEEAMIWNISSYPTNTWLEVGTPDGVYEWKFTKYYINSTDGFGTYTLTGERDPYGMTFDTRDNSFWVTYSSADSIYHFSSLGENLSGSFSVRDWPAGVAYDSRDSSFWVTDTADRFIFHYDSSGNNISGGFATTPSGVNFPRGIVLDPRDYSFWVLNGSSTANNSNIYHYDSFGGSLSDGFAIIGDNYQTDLAFDPRDNSFWVVDVGEKVIRHFSNSSGSWNELVGDRIDTKGIGGGNQPRGIVLDPRDYSFWITDNGEDFIYHFLSIDSFTLINNKTADFSSVINNYLSTCTPDVNGNCTVPFLFHSDTAGILEYDAINITYTPHNITIILNQTLPPTPAINDVVFVNVELNETVGFDIDSVEFTITPPNGTSVYSDVNGTYTKPDANDLFYYNWSSQSFTIDDGGTWTWTYIAKNNESGRADYSEVRETGSFLILDTTAPTILGIDSPTNDTEYVVTSDIDVNVSLSDDMRIDRWWFNIVNGSKPSQILQANTSFTYCGSRTCGNNISQFGFPIADNMTVNIYVNDTSGNEARGQIIKLNVTTDTSKPQISITNPSGAKTSYTIPIIFSITDNVAVDTCEWNITLAGVISNQSGVITNCTIDETITLYLQSETAYVFNVQSNDTNNNWEQDSSVFSIDLPEPPPITPPSVGGPGGGVPPCPKGELYDPLLFKCVSLIKLPENASNLTLTPSRLDKPSIAFTLITEDEALFKQDFKSNFRLSTVEVISGEFNVTIIGNTTVRMSLLLDKKTNWFSQVIEGSFSVTDMFGRTFFVDDIKVTLYNPGYLVFGFIPVLVVIALIIIGIVTIYILKKRGKSIKFKIPYTKKVIEI